MKNRLCYDFSSTLASFPFHQTSPAELVLASAGHVVTPTIFQYEHIASRTVLGFDTTTAFQL